MRNVADKSCRGNKDTHFMLKISFFENRAVNEVMWKNLIQPDKPKITLQYGAEKMRFACLITTVRTDTDTHTHLLGSVIIAFPRQQCLLKAH
jgi:hypothetical protein